LCTFHYFHAVFITTLFKAINLSLLYTQFCGKSFYFKRCFVTVLNTSFAAV